MPRYLGNISSVTNNPQQIVDTQEGYRAAKDSYDDLASYYDYSKGIHEPANLLGNLYNKIRRSIGQKYPDSVNSQYFPRMKYQDPVNPALNTVTGFPQVDSRLGIQLPDSDEILLFDSPKSRDTYPLANTAAHELIHAQGYEAEGYHPHDENPESLMSPYMAKGASLRGRIMGYETAAQDIMKKHNRFPFKKKPKLDYGE
jgi:hypothetical protein